MTIHQLTVVPPAMWLYFSIGVFAILIIDVWIVSKSNGVLTKNKAMLESLIWIGVALTFNAYFAYHYGSEKGVEFLTGYLVEKSLSIDNLFVILLIFNAFKIPLNYQHKVLFLGVLGAVIFRAIFILIGTQLVSQFHWILYIFGAILLYAGINFLRDADEQKDILESWTVKRLRRWVPIVDHLEGQKFFIKKDGLWFVTPLFLALITIEVTDIIFAVDSIPAVFSVTRDPFIAFGSNILAVMGLRALYFVVASLISELRYLKFGLAAILCFIGVKLLLLDFYKIPSLLSLMIIMTIISIAALFSVYYKPKK